jgi:DNA modification methylase
VLEVNNLYHGDCLEVMKNIDDKSINLILTDIPYGGVTKKGSERAKYLGQLRKIDKGVADILTFDIESFLDGLYRISKGSIYIFCGIAQIGQIYSYFDNKKDYMVRQCAWRKTNPPPINGQHMWLSSFENCIFAKKRNTQFNYSCKSSIWDYPTGRSKLHPTEKPLLLFQYLIEASSKEGDLVLDPCIGSGTTAIACINTGRNYIGIEKDENYYNIANERIKKLNV